MLTKKSEKYGTIIHIRPYSHYFAARCVCGGQKVAEFFGYIKSNMKVAAKSVRFNRKKYLPFFAAVFIVGMLFSLLLFSADEAAQVGRETVLRDFDWHVSIRNLNEDQYLYIAKYASPNNRYKPLYEMAKTSDSP